MAIIEQREKRTDAAAWEPGSEMTTKAEQIRHPTAHAFVLCIA